MSNNRPPIIAGRPIAVEDWPMNLETTRVELHKAKKRLERYQAALRLANNEIEQRNRNIIALTTFAYQAGRTTRLGTLLRLTLVQALETTGAPVGAVIVFDSETKALSLGVHRGLTPDMIRILTGQELEQGATALMPHLVAGDGALLEYNAIEDPGEQLLLATARLSTLVSLPLYVGTNLIGTLLVGLQGKRLFKPSELCFLMSLTQEAAIVMDSLRLRDELWQTAETLLGEEGAEARLKEIEPHGLNLDIVPPFDLPATGPTVPQPGENDLEQLLAAMMEAEAEVQQQNTDLQTLNTIAEEMNRTLDLKEILDAAVTQTRQTLETDAAWIYLLNDSDQLELRAHTGLSQVYVRGMHSLPLSNSLEGQVVIENKAVFIEAVSTDTRSHKIWVDKEGLQSLALLPLATANPNTSQSELRAIGVLAVGIRRRTGSRSSERCDNHWPPRKVRLLNSIANQMALAINNARLYAQLQDKEVNVRTGNEVLQTVNDMLLEKNVYLERFIEETLTTSLSQISEFFQRLLPKFNPVLSEADQHELATIKEIISNLGQQIQEADAINAVLNNEFNRVLEQKNKKTDYAGSTKPPRLEKVCRDFAQNPKNSKGATAQEEETPSLEKLEKECSNSNSQETRLTSLSFEEAINAGLVPPHILDREEKQKEEESN